jgi:hypothetical protein
MIDRLLKLLKFNFSAPAEIGEQSTPPMDANAGGGFTALRVAVSASVTSPPTTEFTIGERVDGCTRGLGSIEQTGAWSGFDTTESANRFQIASTKQPKRTQSLRQS